MVMLVCAIILIYELKEFSSKKEVEDTSPEEMKKS